MKNKIYYIETEKAKYPLVFNLNVMEEIQETYGSLTKWGDAVEMENGEPNVKNLKSGILSMINEGIDMENEEHHEERAKMTSKEVGRLITEVGFGKIQEIIKDVTKKSTDNPENSKNM